jgi:hypothetical protein
MPDQAKDVAIREMRAEGQCGDLDVESANGQIIDFDGLCRHDLLRFFIVQRSQERGVVSPYVLEDDVVTSLLHHC